MDSSARQSKTAERRHLRGVGSPQSGRPAQGRDGDDAASARERGLRRRVKRVVLTVVGIFAALLTMVAIGLAKVGAGRPEGRPLLGAAAGVTTIEVLVEAVDLKPASSAAATGEGTAEAVAGGVAAGRLTAGDERPAGPATANAAVPAELTAASGKAAVGATVVSARGAGEKAGVAVAVPPGGVPESGKRATAALPWARPVPLPAARFLAVHLGEEVERTLSLELAPGGAREKRPVRVATGERELARGVALAGASSVAVRLPADLPVGQVPIEVFFGGRAEGGAGLVASGGPGVAGGGANVAPGGEPAGAAAGAPRVVAAQLAPALPPGTARLEGADVVQGGNCLVYVPLRLTSGNEALVGAFVPPPGARAGQRFELSVERQDGTPIRRFTWQPSFWNRLRGVRRFELPLRGVTGAVRLRLIARAGEAGGAAARWEGLGLIDVRGEILTPGQGQ